MATETFKYFIAEQSNLRSEYGSASIINYGGTGGNDGSSAEVSAETLTLRYLSTKINRPLNGTDYIVDFYTLTGFPTYLRISDTFYSLISPYFTTSETNSVVSTLPTNNGTYTYTASRLMQYQPSSRRKTIICIGDSITDGNGTDNGSVGGQLTADKLLVYPTVAINSIAGESLSVINNTGKREMVSNNYKLINIALGGANYDNSVAGGEEQNLYPLRFSLAYNQRVKTLPLNDCIDNIVMSIWLGTNDLNYDSSQTGASVWQRAVNRIISIKSDFPNIKIILGTTIKRSESTTFNNKVDAYNTLIRDNYASIGVSAIADFEGEIPQLNTSTGDTTNTTYYTDRVHVTNLSHTLLAPVWKTALLSALSATFPANPVLATPTVTTTTMVLTWTMSDDTNITDYDIYYKASTSDTWILFSDGTSTAKTATITGLDSGTIYNVMVKAVRNVSGDISVSFSNVVTERTALTASETLYSTANTVYGLRKLNPYYTGQCIRIRRSNDNAESDIGFVGKDLDTATITSFVGANSAFVTTWYDQSGASRHATQTTASLQPRIVNAGVLHTLNGKPTVDQFTLNARLNIPAFSGMSSTILSAVYAQATTNNGSSPWQFNQIDHFPWTNNLAYCGAFSTTRHQFATWSSPANQLIIASAVQTGTVLAIYRNGVQNGGNATTAFTIPTSRTIFGGSNGLGFVSEMVIMGAWDGGATNRTTIQNDQGSYYGITVA